MTTDPRSLAQLRRALAAAEADVRRRSEARRALPPGSSRATVTTANARWSTACEERDRVLRAYGEKGGCTCDAHGGMIKAADNFEHHPACASMLAVTP